MRAYFLAGSQKGTSSGPGAKDTAVRISPEAPGTSGQAIVERELRVCYLILLCPALDERGLEDIPISVGLIRIILVER